MAKFYVMVEVEYDDADEVSTTGAENDIAFHLQDFVEGKAVVCSCMTEDELHENDSDEDQYGLFGDWKEL